MAMLLSLLFLSNFPAVAMARVFPFTYQSSDLTVNEWASLFTLCLAPFLAHVLAGVPSIVFLSQDRPNWILRLTLYNPTSILWRYFAIADRRLRAKHWSDVDMAASNVYFWTCNGWDGSEELMEKSREYCTSSPKSTHTTLVSSSTAKTLIVTLHGLNCLYKHLPIRSLVGTEDFVNATSVGTVFSPIAIMGLLRLVACFWLTDDFSYVGCEQAETAISTWRKGRKQNLVADQWILAQVRTYKPAPSKGVFRLA